MDDWKAHVQHHFICLVFSTANKILWSTYFLTHQDPNDPPCIDETQQYVKLLHSANRMLSTTTSPFERTICSSLSVTGLLT